MKQYSPILLIVVCCLLCIIAIFYFRMQIISLDTDISKEIRIYKQMNILKDKGVGSKAPVLKKDESLEKIREALRTCSIQDALYRMKPSTLVDPNGRKQLQVEIELQGISPDSLIAYLYTMRRSRSIGLYSLSITRNRKKNGIDVSLLLGAMVI